MKLTLALLAAGVLGSGVLALLLVWSRSPPGATPARPSTAEFEEYAERVGDEDRVLVEGREPEVLERAGQQLRTDEFVTSAARAEIDAVARARIASLERNYEQLTGLELQPTAQYMRAQNLLLSSIAVILDSQHRGIDSGEDLVRNRPGYPGEITFSTQGRAYRFDTTEFPEFQPIRDRLVELTRPRDPLSAAEATPSPGGLPAETLLQVEERVAEALALLGKEGNR